ncbi:hypothetical protein [Nocardia sp. NPDC051832]|uniref:hypothetical protein n=1 Tax=Nocardia sp. NPDC051832 TaxID=3155673 RepID=UPI0034217493
MTKLSTPIPRRIPLAFAARATRVLVHHAGDAIAFLLRTPFLLFALAAVAIVLQASALLTYDREPSVPASPTASASAPQTDGCWMFCAPADPTPVDAENSTATHPASTSPTALATADATTARCWMFCTAPDPQPILLAAGATNWHMDL